MEYKNEICQGCGRKFAEGDDIVVCPECGTPQHRECYNKEHKCVNEHLHGENYEWKPKHAPTPEEKPQASESEKKFTCPFCGYENDPNAKICENCGQPIGLFRGNPFADEPKPDDGNYEYKPPFQVGDFTPDENGYRANEDQNSGQFQNGQNGAFIFTDDIPDGETDGVSNRDIKLYVRSSVASYYKKFKAIDSKKPTFNWGAFIFGYLWFFFRKMFKSGVIFLTAELCLIFAFYNPVMSTYESMSEAVVNIQQAENDSQAQAIAEEANRIFAENKTAISVFFASIVVLRLVSALTADRLYKKKVIKDIKKINEDTDDDQAKLAEFFKKGGSSFITAFIGYFLRYIIALIVTGVFFE